MTNCVSQNLFTPLNFVKKKDWDSSIRFSTSYSFVSNTNENGPHTLSFCEMLLQLMINFASYIFLLHSMIKKRFIYSYLFSMLSVSMSLTSAFTKVLFRYIIVFKLLVTKFLIQIVNS